MRVLIPLIVFLFLVQASGQNEDAPNLIQIGLDLQQQGDFDNALLYYEKALTIDPALGYAWQYKGDILFLKGYYDEAVNCYERSESCGYSINWMEKGDELFNTEKFDEALIFYKKASIEEGDDPKLLSKMAETSFKLRNYEDASLFLKQIIDLGYADSNTWFKQGYCLFYFEEYDEAISAYKQAEALGESVDWEQIGDELLDKEKYIESLKFYQIALDESPNDSSIMESMGLAYYSQENYEMAIRYFEAVIDNGDANYKIYDKVGRSLIHQEEYDNAIDIYSKCIDQGYAFDWSERGNELFSSSDYLGAEKFYKQAINKNQNDAFSWKWLGRSQWVQEIPEKQEDALYSYRYALDLDKSDSETCLWMADALKDVGRYDESIYYYNRALSLNPSFQEAKTGKEKAVTSLTDQWIGKGRDSLNESGFLNPRKYSDAIGYADRALNLDQTNLDASVLKQDAINSRNRMYSLYLIIILFFFFVGAIALRYRNQRLHNADARESELQYEASTPHSAKIDLSDSATLDLSDNVSIKSIVDLSDTGTINASENRIFDSELAEYLPRNIGAAGIGSSGFTVISYKEEIPKYSKCRFCSDNLYIDNFKNLLGGIIKCNKCGSFQHYDCVQFNENRCNKCNTLLF